MMSDLGTLKQKVTEMQAEIERLEAKEREPEIARMTPCWFTDKNCNNETIGFYDGALKGRHKKKGGYLWDNARIANDIPGVMVFQNHDGGPCPVDNVRIIAMSSLGFIDVGTANDFMWENVAAYAIISKAEWME